MQKPAIVAVGYNRPHCMKRLLESIGKAYYPDQDVTLIVSIDESNLSDAVQKVAEDFEWKYGEKIIRRFPERQGLRNHIIRCGDLSEQYGSVIILEDDLYVSPGFYTYVQQAHARYDDDPRIAGVSLYSNGVNVFSKDRFVPARNQYDNYFGQYIITWGESWSFAQWKKYKEWYLKHEDQLPAVNDAMPEQILRWNRSWGKYFISYMVENNLYYVMAYTSLSTNFSERGEHTAKTGYVTAYQVPLLTQPIEYRFAPFEEGVKYDSFFERMCDVDLTDEINSRDVCFDLGGNRMSALDKKYLLTCKKYDLPVVKTYGLRMRPIEENVLNNIEGVGITLYALNGDVPLNNRKRKRTASEIVMAKAEYEIQGLNYRQLTPYTFSLCLKLLGMKLKSTFKR